MRRGALLALALLVGCGEQSVELFDATVTRADAAEVPVDTTLRDPERCGALAIHCEDDEYCVAGACVCRPPLTRIAGRCVDTDADALHCGGADRPCSLCVSGACGTTCPAGTEECAGACVDTQTHPLHCGECGRPCGSDDVCVAGLCRSFLPAPCTSCPCGCARSCCAYPTRPTDTICVDADACPS